MMSQLKKLQSKLAFISDHPYRTLIITGLG